MTVIPREITESCRDTGVLVAVAALDKTMLSILRALEQHGKLNTREVLRYSKTNWLKGHSALQRAAALGLVRRWNDNDGFHAVIYNRLTWKGRLVLEIIDKALSLSFSGNSYGPQVLTDNDNALEELEETSRYWGLEAGEDDGE